MVITLLTMFVQPQRFIQNNAVQELRDLIVAELREAGARGRDVMSYVRMLELLQQIQDKYSSPAILGSTSSTSVTDDGLVKF